ncbi:membrane protein [Deltaproteobacteria bacterium]|nr:membrane protein [Deltaproteobacteria bacterium]
MTLHTKCLFTLVLTAVLWSPSGFIMKNVEASALAIAGTRAFFAVLTLSVLNRKNMPSRLPNKKQCLAAIMMASIALTFVVANQLTTAANAILLQYTAPVWVAIAAPFFLKEKTNRQDWLFIIVTFCGIGVFFLDNLSSAGLLGMGVALGGGISYAGLAMVLRCVKEEEKTICIVYGNALLVAAGLFAVSDFHPSLRELALLVFAGIMQNGVGYYLFCRASRGVSALEMMLVTTLEPILNPVWVYLGIGEQPGTYALVGGAVVLITVTLWSVIKSKE